MLIDPCIPPTWKEYKVLRKFRGKELVIIVQNPNGVQKGIKQITLNGEALSGNIIPLTKMKQHSQILVEMG
jgi:cellobiose phosphorylase